MKWYQHDSNCHNDEKIRHLIHEEGLEAYAVYHICLELISEKIDETKKHWIEISERVLCEKLCMRLTRVQRMLNSSSFQVLLQTHNEHGMFILSCPNLLKRLDNWTKRSVVTTKQVPLQLESNKKEKKKDIEKEATPKSLDQVKSYFQELGFASYAQDFYEFYASKGWVVGRSPMKDWKCAANRWTRNQKNYQTKEQKHESTRDRIHRIAEEGRRKAIPVNSQGEVTVG